MRKANLLEDRGRSRQRFARLRALSGRLPPPRRHHTGLTSPGDACLSKRTGQNVGKFDRESRASSSTRSSPDELPEIYTRSHPHPEPWTPGDRPDRGGAAAPRRRPRPRRRDGLDRRPPARRRRRRHRRADHRPGRRDDARPALQRARRAGRRAAGADRRRRALADPPRSARLPRPRRRRPRSSRPGSRSST